MRPARRGRESDAPPPAAPATEPPAEVEPALRFTWTRTPHEHPRGPALGGERRGSCSARTSPTRTPSGSTGPAQAAGRQGAAGAAPAPGAHPPGRAAPHLRPARHDGRPLRDRGRPPDDARGRRRRRPPEDRRLDGDGAAGQRADPGALRAERVDVFPPPGPDRRDDFFAERSRRRGPGRRTPASTSARRARPEP